MIRGNSFRRSSMCSCSTEAVSCMNPRIMVQCALSTFFCGAFTASDMPYFAAVRRRLAARANLVTSAWGASSAFCMPAAYRAGAEETVTYELVDDRLRCRQGIVHAPLYRHGAAATVTYELVDGRLRRRQGIVHAHLYRLGAVETVHYGPFEKENNKRNRNKRVLHQ